MQLKQYYKLIFFFFFLSLTGYGQSFVTPDSLKSKSYKELRDAFYKNIDVNKPLAELYFWTYFDRSKKDVDSARITKSYFMKSKLQGKYDIRQIGILDSAILYGKNIKKKHNPEVLYNRRALQYDHLRDFENSLKDFLIALAHSKRKNNIPYIHLVKHNIATLKRKLGNYSDAKKLLNECLVYEKSRFLDPKTKWDTIGYLQTLTELVSVYRLTGQLDSARVLNKNGVILSRGKEISVLFDLNDGILDYYNKEYRTAEEKIERNLPKLIDPEPDSGSDYDLIEGLVYLGKINMDTGNVEKATKYFKNVDSISRERNYYILESRPAYIELIKHYKSNGDDVNQLKYINKLLVVDSVVASNYRINNDQMIKEFDTKELLQEKQKIITALEAENKSISSKNIIISLLLGLSLFGVMYYNYRQRLFKKRFLQLRDRTTKQEGKSKQSNGATINKETVTNLLDQLQKFEEDKGYLKTNLNAKDLAKSFGSNSSYLSKVINTFKEKTFSNYINDLRIGFVIDRLQKDRMFRKFTIKAIAQEIGFNNAEAFSKAFYKNTGIYPSYFIKELEK